MAGKLPSDAFEAYVALGPGRSYQAVASKFGVTKRAVTKLAAKERWQDRVEALETKARAASEQKTLESLEQMNTRHLKSLRVIQGKALEALKAMSIDSAMDAVRALDLSIKGERLVRGEPSDRTALSVEDAIRREFDRWTTVDDDERENDEEEKGALQQEGVL